MTNKHQFENIEFDAR